MSYFSQSSGKNYVYFFFAFCIVILIGFDIAFTLQSPSTVTAIPVSQLKSDGVPDEYRTKVAMIRSDDSVVENPAALDVELSLEQINDMVFKVLDLSGDLKPLLFEGANVVIKPNVVEPANLGNGVNTDPRVIEGLIRWMAQNGPDRLNYIVAEGGGGWLSPRMRNTKYNSGGAPVADGYQQAGYYQMQDRLAADHIHVEIVDADFGSYENPLQGIRLAPVPDWIDFPEYSEYWIHEAILDADVLINVPVMKMHTPQITVCLKNYIGIAAGAKYGTYKGVGGPDPGDPKLHRDWPDHNSVELEIIDLASIAPSDYCLVDAIVCKERGKTATHPAVRRNMVLAGTDMVAIDAVCARLMGLNPDDVAHLVNAAREGLGTMNPDQIEIASEHSIDDSMYYFERTQAGSQGNRGHFGMTNRVWLLNSAAGDNLDTAYLGIPDADAIGTPNQGGWTEPIYFSDEYIDFEAYYGPSNSNVFYAFCWVDVPEEQDAELWITHDESCAVWLGGEQIYYQALRYRSPALPSASAGKIHLPQGRHPLLVKLVDTTGNATFVMNICRILPTQLPAGKATYTNLRTTTNYARYKGTRVMGLKFEQDASAGVTSWESF